MRRCTQNHFKFYQIGWKANYFNSADVSMLGHGCGVSKFPQFYDIIKKQILKCPYVGSYEGEKGNLFLKEKWILDLEKSVELFMMVSINDIPTIKYWKTLKKIWFVQKRRSQNNEEW